MFRGDDYNHNYRDSFIEGAIWGGFFAICLSLLWRCRWVLALLAAGFWLSYHTSGEAARDNLIAAKFDENLVKMTSFRIDADRSSYRPESKFRSVKATIENQTSATLTGFAVYCSFYEFSEIGGNKNTPRRTYYGRPRGDQTVSPNTTKTFEMKVDWNDEDNFIQADRTSVDCKISTREFDKQEQLRSIAKK